MSHLANAGPIDSLRRLERKGNVSVPIHTENPWEALTRRLFVGDQPDHCRAARTHRCARERQCSRNVLPFGAPGIDPRLPGGGLAVGALHEIAGGGGGTVYGAVAALKWPRERPEIRAHFRHQPPVGAPALVSRVILVTSSAGASQEPACRSQWNWPKIVKATRNWPSEFRRASGSGLVVSTRIEIVP